MKKLRPQQVDWAQIARFLQSADKKLASAHKILAFDEEACLQQAYEAMLEASLGFMFGIRVPRQKPTGASHRDYRIRPGTDQQKVHEPTDYVRPTPPEAEQGPL